MDVGERIQQLRKNNHLSQEQLAERLQISRQSISKWESGQSLPELDKVVQLSKVFEVTTDYLLTGATVINPVEQIQGGKSQAFIDNGMLYSIVASGINVIGLVAMITLWNTWYRELAFGIGLIIQIIGCMCFEVGAYFHKRNDCAKYVLDHLKYYGLNVWLLLFVPISYGMAKLQNGKIFAMPYKYYALPYIAACTFITCILGAITYFSKQNTVINGKML